VTTDITKLKRTALCDAHIKLGGKMVEFAGFYMPVVYSSIIEEHKCVRTAVGIFDVSHMGEFRFTGDKALEQIQKVTVNDASKLETGQIQYSAMCYPDGGIVDDLLVYRFDDHYLMVVNGANVDNEFAWIEENAIEGAEFTNASDDITLLAVQGPNSRDLVQELTDIDLLNLKYYHAVKGETAGISGIISRTGYTGELGFELYIPCEYSEQLFNSLMDRGRKYGLMPIGLGARDTLRLEKKMCLYGNDITKDTNPLEAGLGWITKLDKGDFIGRDALIKIKEAGIKRKLAGFESLTKVVPRHGYEIVKDGATIGEITSGSYSPMLEKGIGLGFIAVEHVKVGAEIMFRARGKDNPAIIVKTPFV